jgi:hypothetical protein
MLSCLERLGHRRDIFTEELEGVYSEHFGEAFDHLQARIALAPFETADVSSMDFEDVGELFLREVPL